MQRQRTNRAFTLIEFLVVVAIIGVLAALVLGTIGRAHDTARRAACGNNLRQIGQALLMYGGDNEDRVPPGESQLAFAGISSQPFSKGFGCLIGRYLPAATSPGTGMWNCPSQTDSAALETNNAPGWTSASDQYRWRGSYSYAFRTRNKMTGLIEPPSLGSWGTGPWPGISMRDGNYAFAFDHCNSTAGPGRKLDHKTGYNCVFYDGHVEFFGGANADVIDYIVGASGTPQAANYNTCWKVFDAAQGIAY